MKPRPKQKQTETDKEPEFPAHYHIIHNAGITRRQVDEVLVKQYHHLLNKLKKSVAYKVEISLSDNQAMEVIHEAIAATVKQYEKNQSGFKCQRDLFAYLLLSSWRIFRNANIKATKQRHQQADVEMTELLDETDVAEETEIDNLDFTQLRGNEEFIAFVHERVYDYLDDCYLDGQFTLREISIFKIYCVQNYSIKRMTEETMFSRTSIVTALSKIKKHLATVDFRWHQFNAHVVTQ